MSVTSTSCSLLPPNKPYLALEGVWLSHMVGKVGWGLLSVSGMKLGPEVPVAVSWAQVVPGTEGKGLLAGSFCWGEATDKGRGCPHDFV